MENISPLFVLVLGMGTVFVGLFCLIILTKLMSKLIGTEKPLPAKEAPAAAAAADTIPDRKAFDAAVAAAIATYIGVDVKGLRIHSIKRV